MRDSFYRIKDLRVKRYFAHVRTYICLILFTGNSVVWRALKAAFLKSVFQVFHRNAQLFENFVGIYSRLYLSHTLRRLYETFRPLNFLEKGVRKEKKSVDLAFRGN